MSVRPTSLACSRMMTSESSGAETVSGSSGNLGSSNGNINHPTATTRTASSMPVTFKRKLGGNELYCNQCHNVNGNLNVLAGLTLLTRHAVDEGKDNAMQGCHVSVFYQTSGILAFMMQYLPGSGFTK
jgi:hypothetical protein